MLRLNVASSIRRGPGWVGTLWLLGTVVATLVIAVTFGVTWRDASRYLAYVAAYELFPGACVYLLLVRQPRGRATVLLHGLILGLLLEVWTYFLLVLLGRTGYHWLYPAGAAILAVSRRRTLLSRLPPAAPVGPVETLASLVIPAALVFAAALHNFQPPIDQHFTWVAAFANAVDCSWSWPPQEPFLFDVPLAYHYLYNVHVAAARAGAGVPVLVVAARLGAIVHLFVLIALMVNFTRLRFQCGWVGLLAALQILGSYGFTWVMWRLFHQATSLILVELPSALVGLELFLVLAAEVADLVTEPRFQAGHFLLAGTMLFAASGLRANFLPVFLGALGVLALFVWRTTQAFPRRVAALAVVALASLAVGMVVFYGFGSSSSSASTLRFSPFNSTVAYGGGEGSQAPSPLYECFYKATSNERLASLLYILSGLVGRLGFLFPGVFVYFAGYRFQKGDLVTPLFAGAYAAGVGMLVLLVNKYQEQWAFAWFGDVAIALLGAEGLRRLVAGHGLPVLRVSLAGLALVAGAIQGYEWSIPLVNELPTLRRCSTPVAYCERPEFNELVHWSRKAFPRGAVLFTTGVEQIDSRVWPVVLPGVQLYSHPDVLDIYLARKNPDRRLLQRRALLLQPQSLECLLCSVREDVPKDRRLFVLWSGPGGPGALPNLIPLFANRDFQVFECRAPTDSPADLPRLGGASPSTPPRLH